MSNLYSKLQKIGIRVTSNSHKEDCVDIEKTIVDALYEIDKDSRLLGLLLSWIEIHGQHLVADKLIKYYTRGITYRGECPWIVAIGAFLVHKKDYRFKKLVKKLDSELWQGGIPQATALKMDGAVEYLEPCNILIPKKHLRIRYSDILTKEELIKINQQYANRFKYGANWRSEIITLMEKGLETPYQIAKDLGISPSRVSLVFNEFKLVNH